MNNEFFDSFKEAVKGTAKTVAEKTEEFVENSKIQYEIFELNRDVKKLYSDIGRLTYLSVECGDDFAGEIKTKCDIAKSKLAKIDVLKNSEEKTKTRFNCPVCGKPNDVNDDYCSSCGANMTVDVDTDIEKEDTVEKDGEEE